MGVARELKRKNAREREAHDKELADLKLTMERNQLKIARDLQEAHAEIEKQVSARRAE